jgi:hypothetical protein
VGLDVDYEAVTATTFYGDNAREIEEPNSPCDIVNLDAGFPIPAEFQGKDKVFPRLEIQAKIFQKIIARRKERGLPGLPEPTSEIDAEELSRRPDYAAEWQDLRRVWGWIEESQNELADKAISKTCESRYSKDPLSGNTRVEKANDWLWRFLSKIADPEYLGPFEAAAEVLNRSSPEIMMDMFDRYYADRLNERSELYNSVLKQFFANYDEFAQTLTMVKYGIDIEFDAESTEDFDSISMFYGNAYEALGTLVGIVAFVNNVFQGRKFDEFERLTLQQYEQLDKPARFGPFSNNDQLKFFRSESDNGLRNASHHRRLRYSPRYHTVSYRKGKAGKGDWVEMSYGKYVERCCRIFCVLVTLLRFELLMCQALGKKNVIHPDAPTA